MKKVSLQVHKNQAKMCDLFSFTHVSIETLISNLMILDLDEESTVYYCPPVDTSRTTTSNSFAFLNIFKIPSCYKTKIIATIIATSKKNSIFFPHGLMGFIFLICYFRLRHQLFASPAVSSAGHTRFNNPKAFRLHKSILIM